jgi:hypothetical protein
MKNLELLFFNYQTITPDRVYYKVSNKITLHSHNAGSWYMFVDSFNSTFSLKVPS